MEDSMLEKIIGGTLLGIGGFVFIVIFSLLFAFPIKWLWNWLMPVIFSLPEISVWQALGLNFLSSLLLRSSNLSTSKE